MVEVSPQTALQTGVVFVDVETSSLYIDRGARVIEVAAMPMDGPLFHRVLNVRCWLDENAVKVHGITYAHLRQGAAPLHVYTRLADILSGRTVVAHNAPFDIRFLTTEFSRFLLPFPDQYVCTLKLARKLIPKEKIANYKLGTLYTYFYGTPPKDTHRAGNDVIILRDVWNKLHELYNQVCG